ncbi:MAG: hypothetical protein JWN40_3543 [Phycisphaerales bacterium]|nr:hypothetical protein [Phycisphaerales bacterium]
MPGSVVVVVLTLGLIAAGVASAHDPLTDLPAPTSVPEAWDVIGQSLANIATCIQTAQFKEIDAHVSNCSPALRVLQADAKRQNDKPLYDQLEALYYSGDAIITAARLKEGAAEKASTALAAHRAAVDAVSKRYAPEVLAARVYACPMHPLERSLDPAAPCPKCAMKLIRRRIPASTTYEKPGAASMKLTAKPDEPLQVGRKATITMTLTKNDGTPVTRDTLLLMHTQKIHLLIIDASLSDYHHEHPTPTAAKPGEYVFAFTPARPGPYRIFADVVPAESSVQEYVIADLPADTPPNPIEDRQTRLLSQVDGFHFAIKFATPDQKLRANQPIAGELSVLSPSALPFKQLEPIMGSFAQLVAFN